MSWLLGSYGFWVGLGFVPLAVWLYFIYPYGEGQSLRPLWVGLFAGLAAGAAGLAAVVFLFARAWPGD